MRHAPDEVITDFGEELYKLEKVDPNVQENRANIERADAEIKRLESGERRRRRLGRSAR